MKAADDGGLLWPFDTQNRLLHRVCGSTSQRRNDAAISNARALNDSATANESYFDNDGRIHSRRPPAPQPDRNWIRVWGILCGLARSLFPRACCWSLFFGVASCLKSKSYRPAIRTRSRTRRCRRIAAVMSLRRSVGLGARLGGHRGCGLSGDVSPVGVQPDRDKTGTCFDSTLSRC